MKLRKKPSILRNTKQEKADAKEAEKASKKAEPQVPNKEGKKDDKLPSDEYPQLIEPKMFTMTENYQLVIRVARDKTIGLPYVDLRQYQTTDAYMGFTKKGIYFPIEVIADLIEQLTIARDEIQELGLFKEVGCDFEV